MGGCMVKVLVVMSGGGVEKKEREREVEKVRERV